LFRSTINIPTEGSEEVVNGDFATDSDWTKGTGWTISGGTANCDGTGGGSIYQDISGVENTRYAITLTISGYTSGTLQIGGSTNNLEVDEDGTFTHYRTWTSDSILYLKSKSGDGFNGSIDNVSVKEYTSADMDVTRATAATRVDEDGLVNYAEIIGDELVTCGDFSCATPSTYWTATNAVISFDNNQLTVDDTAGAGADSRGSQTITTENGKTYRLTFNKISTTTLFYLGVGSGSSYNNIVASNLGTDTGEYTIEFTATSSSTTIAFISGGNGITVFSSISVKEVTKDNVPRIDYTGGGCPHILAEPQRTNTVTYSEVYGSGTFFSGTTGSVIDNTTNTSPSGEDNATQLTSTGAGKLQSGALSLTQNTDYVLSFYAKNVDGTLVSSRVYATGGSGGSNLTSVNYQSEISTTEWTRITHIFNTGTNTTFFVYLANGLNSGGTIQLWGAQLEVGSYATSYIPTSGSAVTRNQDQFTRDGIGSLINDSEGVLFAEIAALDNDGTFRMIAISDGTIDNVVNFYYRTDINKITIRLKSGATQEIFENFDITATNFNKVAFRYKSGESNLFINGVKQKVSDYTATNMPVGLSQLTLDSGGNTNFFYGKVKQLQVYNTALTDEQLLQLTGTSGTDFYESYAEMASALTYTIQ